MTLTVDHTDLWTYPPEMDGWFIAHRAIRAGFKAIQHAPDAFIAQLKNNQTLSISQVDAVRLFWEQFLSFVHHHHGNEEQIAFPFIAKRAELPPKLLEDHEHLMEEFKACDGMFIAAIRTSGPEESCKRFMELKEHFTTLESDMRIHFLEEETTGMPILRKAITPKEYVKNITTPIIRTLTPMDNGTFFTELSKEEFRQFARQEHIPFFIVWLLKWQMSKYRKVILNPFYAAIAEAEKAGAPAS